ncbi:oligopeptidase A [Cephaloticoccus capnophilus]|uniref:oligopeptidase A n=1 Tax=Cephaloticoccus capnophilus TaxID=1548208 RepID=A0A139SNF1_9BACT|nr:M3 family metallopeptidase [Cephaloticoccus capnophilus]KXU36089.1 oligopeptidase A [Cephaloticoccus capnophilus]
MQALSSPNPFLDSVFEVRWQRCRPECVEPAIVEALVEARGEIEKIATQPLEGLSFESTFLALEKATERLGTAWGLVTHWQSVADSPALRQAHNAMLPQVSAFYSSIPLNPELWRRLKAFNESAAAGEVQGIERRLMEETLADFVQAGADLPDEKRARLAALQSELAQVTQKYSENVLDATNAWELIVEDEARLAGLPEHAKEAARQSAAGAGRSTGWRFTLHQPSQEPVMVYAQDESLRRELWEAAVAVGTREPHDNTALVRQILTLRAEKAALLGKPNFAEVVLERRMAQGGARALAFVEDLGARAAAAFAQDTSELEKFKAAQTSEPVAKLAPWDLAFWAEKLRQKKHAFDEEALRPYFALGSVVEGLFELVRRVFGVVVKERAAGAAEVWHPEVRFYDLFDADSGEQLGSFYSDWHPRDAKRGGAWMNYLRTGARSADMRTPHLGLICGNLTPPVGERPALLTHREVETVFHEFGHLLHHLLGEIAVKSLNGVNVAWDFVELPSQIMENWCWEREALDLFARHYETGERIPDALFEAMSAARNFRSATFLMRQVSLAKLDLLLHTDSARYLAASDIETAIRAAIAPHLVPTEPSAPTVLTRFGHIFSDPVGYAAGYYSYQWAAVLDADAFTRFKREGLFNRQTGRAFREAILSRGNAAPPMELYREFMGREPDLQAHLARSGI